MIKTCNYIDTIAWEHDNKQRHVGPHRKAETVWKLTVEQPSAAGLANLLIRFNTKHEVISHSTPRLSILHQETKEIILELSSQPNLLPPQASVRILRQLPAENHRTKHENREPRPKQK